MTRPRFKVRRGRVHGRLTLFYSWKLTDRKTGSRYALHTWRMALALVDEILASEKGKR